MRLVSFAILGLVVSLTAAAAQAPTKKPAPPAGQKVPPPAPSAAALAVTMPPIPSPGYAPGRPVDVARAVYKFAGEHPEVLKYVPCYCGCENLGHKGNHECFVKRRAVDGRVLEWEPHGSGCTICVDVARDAMLMFNSGASVSAIRSAIDQKWGSRFPSQTPTPVPAKAAAKPARG